MSVQTPVLEIRFPCESCARQVLASAKEDAASFPCKCPSCGAKYDVQLFRAVGCVTGRPELVIRQIVDTIFELAEDPMVERFYIGRSNHVLVRNTEHKADRILELYRTTSPDNAMVVEDALIKAFHDHEKNQNDANHCGGNVGEGDQYVYVALWYT